MKTRAHSPVSPIDAAKAITPRCMQNIHDFDALEIEPCVVVGHGGLHSEIVEPCEPQDAHFWTVYGHFRTGGVDALDDFPTKAEALAFHDRLIALYPHLAGREAPPVTESPGDAHA